MFCVSGADGPFIKVWLQLWMKWSCKFCSFATYNEKTIVSHYKDNHGRGRRGLSCIYQNCLTVLQSHMEFVQHVKEHKKGANPVAKIRCELCTFSAPTNMQFCKMSNCDYFWLILQLWLVLLGGMIIFYLFFSTNLKHILLLQYKVYNV